MIFQPIALEDDIWTSGIGKKTDTEHLFDDLPTLSKEYAKIRPDIKNQIKPLYTCVATREDRIFMGDFVKKKDKTRESFCLKKGQWVVKVPIKFHFQVGLPAKVAALRKDFYQNWLPESEFKSATQWQDLEVYHYRRRYFRKSRKMIMELWFLIEKKEDQYEFRNR